ncbi:hypothetical protein ACLMJK_009443 [Lecanora helva]
MGLLSTSKHRALKVESVGKLGVRDCLLPQLHNGDILVRVRYISLNPTDGKSAELSPTLGATSGCDFAGEVIGPEDLCRKLGFQVGDRVFGCTFGNNPYRHDNGAFAEYVAVPAKLLLHIPETMTFQTAATMGTGLATVGLALYHNLQLPLPSTPTPQSMMVLVYGGGTATGTIALQMLRLSGITPIATCSPASFSHVKSLGAAAVFDYQSPTCGDSVREYTSNTLAYAMDCITDSTSMKICYEAIGSAGGQYVALDPFPLRVHKRRSVRPDWVIMFSQFEQKIGWQGPYDLDERPEDRSFAEGWYKLVQGLLEEGKLVGHRLEERSGGLEGARDGVKLVRDGKVKGSKLVYAV